MVAVVKTIDAENGALLHCAVTAYKTIRAHFKDLRADRPTCLFDFVVEQIENYFKQLIDV
jgi:hypothetical protein